jgi:signal transduction histidine kinase
MKLTVQRLIHWQPTAGLILAFVAIAFPQGNVPASALLPPVVAANQSTNSAAPVKISSLAELHTAVTERGRAIVSFEIGGIVCAVLAGRNSVVLQDQSASILLELPGLDSRVQSGDRLRIAADQGTLTRGRFGIQFGTAPVVNHDGTHPSIVKSGLVYLRTGQQPMRLEWFNGVHAMALRVEYEGPGVARQEIPAEMLWHKIVVPTKTPDFQQGLNFAAYTGKGWYSVPDFTQLKPVAQGVTPHFDIERRVGETDTALIFTGYLQIHTPGLYTFFVHSDDGSRLFVGDPADSCHVTLLAGPSVPVVKSFEEVLAAPVGSHWAELEGMVTFVSQNDSTTELEVVAGEERMSVSVLGGAADAFTSMLNQCCRVLGVCEVFSGAERKKCARVIVPGPDGISVREAPPARTFTTNAVLTTARQVQRLKPEEARAHRRVTLKGVVTQAALENLVLQDATGGVFIHFSAAEWTDQPRVGELWEISGTTDPGDFSPVIRATTGKFLGNGSLPEAVRPTWDQLMNGSLDAQYVELRGVVTGISETGITLLTQDGILLVDVSELSKSYRDGRELFVEVHAGVAIEEMRQTYLDSVVRMRGCLAAMWDLATRQLKAGEIRLLAAAISVEEARPRNPFALPTRRVADLLLFDPHASAFQRTKVAGTVLHVRPRECFIMDGATSLRCLTRDTLLLQPGDVVEAVGFPQLGNAAPALLEAQVHQTGTALLPKPALLAPDALLDRKYDATRVQVEALLVNDSIQQGERVLELQAGPQQFVARLKNHQHGGKAIVRGSRLQLTGVYASARENRAGGVLDPFELLLNHPGDILILQQGPWWTVRHTIAVVAVLSGGLFLALIWVSLLRRTVAQRTVQLKHEIEERQIVEQRRAMEQERTRVAHDLHDELGAGLTEVGLLGDLVKNPSIPTPEKEQYLGQLTDTARSLVTSLDEIVWAVNPRYDSVASLASYYILFAQRFLDLAGIACRPQIPASFPECPLDPQERHGLFLALKEALNNVIRHSGATEVRLKIEFTAAVLGISVADNGRGFETTGEIPDGDGLQTMRSRLENLGGTCEVVSQPGAGTKIELRLPVRKRVP